MKTATTLLQKPIGVNTEAADNVATGLLSLHRGLFVKLYCIADDAQPVKAMEVVANDLHTSVYHRNSTMERAVAFLPNSILFNITPILLGTEYVNVPLAMAGQPAGFDGVSPAPF